MQHFTKMVASKDYLNKLGEARIFMTTDPAPSFQYRLVQNCAASSTTAELLFTTIVTSKRALG